MSTWFRLPFYWQTLLAMLLGVLVGGAFGENALFLGAIAQWIVKLVKALATPLLFLSILDAILNSQFRGRGVAAMFLISGINALFAITIGLTLSNLFQPGRSLLGIAEKVPLNRLGAEAASKTTWLEATGGYVPDSIVGPFLSNSIPAVILLAVLLGLSYRSLLREGVEFAEGLEKFRTTVKFLLALSQKSIGWVVHAVPLAVFGSVAKVIGTHGVQVVGGLGAYLLVVLAGMAIHVGLVYQAWIKGVAKRSLRQFWRESKEPVAYAFGVNSSLATLPITLRSLDRLGISQAASRLSACVGTNFNNDGILLYEVMAAMFLAQAYGLHLSVFSQLGLALVCLAATVGVAGIPEAGIISLTLVLGAIGLPIESIPLLLTVDWLLARLRSVVNVIGDMTGAIGIDHLAGKGEVKGASFPQS